MISNDTEVQENLKKAELDPTPVMLSDWVHLTSEELRDVAVTANVDTMSVSAQGPRYCRLIFRVKVVLTVFS